MDKKTRAALLLLACAVLAPNASSRAASSKSKLDADVVRRVIHRDIAKVNRCYESALRYDPELEGKVAVRFAIVPKGYVRSAQVVSNTTGSSTVGRCVTRIVSNIRFPRRRYGKTQRFTFPFVFARQGP